MTNDQIFLNGAPIVGFGDIQGAVPPIEHGPVIGILVGATGGAILGALVKKGIGAAVGAVVGGLGGAFVGVAIAKATPNNPPPSWRLAQQFPVGVKAGQQIAMAVVGPNGAPIPPADVAQLDALLTALSTAPANLPVRNFVKYPPGSQLPPDWPADDDLGANAYRITEDVLIDMPTNTKPMRPLPPDAGMFKIWVR